MNTIIELDKEDVKKAIADYVKKTTNIDDTIPPSAVTIIVDMVEVGPEMNITTQAVFKQAIVKV